MPTIGLAPRRIAVQAVDHTLNRRLPLDQTLDEAIQAEAELPDAGPLDPRDIRLARSIATATFRRLGLLRNTLARRMMKGAPRGAGPVEAILLTGAAQILDMDTPDHSAVNAAVSLTQAMGRGARYAELVNAVLRRIAREKDRILADADEDMDDSPGWLIQRWTAAYGAATAHRICAAHRHGLALDLTLRPGLDPVEWAQTLDADLLATGSLRLRGRQPVETLQGFEDGAWWVQDAAAALPARLTGAAPGLRVLDMCAAPGGKTLQLAAAGADVTALDRSAPRLERVRDNLARIGLTAACIAADAAGFSAEPFDAVLVDAPCSATGTIRRHPDVAWIKQDDDIAKLAATQARLLARAVDLTRIGGIIVYASCSLEPEEGEEQIAALLGRDARLVREPVRADEIGGQSDMLTADGDLRALPFHLAMADPDPTRSGCDGFYAARLRRIA